MLKSFIVKRSPSVGGNETDGEIRAAAIKAAGAWLRVRWPLVLGLAALIIPTLLSLAQWSWSTESGAHGPIVLATGLWLMWRERSALALAQRQPFWPAGIALLLALPAYAVGRITSNLAIECVALYAILLAVAWMQLGPVALRRFWFPCVYFLFLITPPENWLFVATRPLKTEISNLAVDLLSALGLSIGSTGVMIQIDGVQLEVATACSGINSLIGISALSLFYVYLRHGSAPRYAFFLTVLLLPIAVLANFVRILLLILITHFFGEAAGQGIAHGAAGMGMFVLALFLLIGIDAVLYPVAVKLDSKR